MKGPGSNGSGLEQVLCVACNIKIPPSCAEPFGSGMIHRVSEAPGYCLSRQANLPGRKVVKRKFAEDAAIVHDRLPKERHQPAAV